MNEMDPIEEELTKAGTATSVSPLVVKLDKFRIMSDTDVPPEDFLLRLFGKPCFPRRDLSAITGTEKCGKTYFTTMLMACCAEKNVLELERVSDEPLKVMWYDTEQSRQSTKSILTERVFKLVHTESADSAEIIRTHTESTESTEKNSPAENNSPAEMTEMTEILLREAPSEGLSAISAISAGQYKTSASSATSARPLEKSTISAISAISAGHYNTSAGESFDLDSNFFVFNVRACTFEERMDYLVAGIEAYKPDMVIIDNVSDLLPSINDPEGSARVIDQLMQLSTENNCNITIVIHLNRTGEKRNLRGWLGTEILHKAFDVYYCEQIEKTDVFSVEQTFTRKYRIPETLYYTIDEDGLPNITTKPASYQPREGNGRYMTNKPEAYQIKTEKAESFNQNYIIRNDSNARQPWEWNLRSLFFDAMGVQPSMPLEALKNEVMSLSGIKQPKYYEKVFRLAVDQRIVQTTLDKRKRVVAILTPS